MKTNIDNKVGVGDLVFPKSLNYYYFITKIDENKLSPGIYFITFEGFNIKDNKTICYVASYRFKDILNPSKVYKMSNGRKIFYWY